MMTLELADGRIPVIAGTEVLTLLRKPLAAQRFNDSGIVGCLTVTLTTIVRRKRFVSAFQSHR